MASQPSRFVLIYCKLNDIPHEVIATSVLKGDVRTPEFKKMNPNMKVPVIRDADLVLYESHAIVRYLSTK